MGARVILVEDEADLAEPLVSTLREAGYEVTWFNRGGPAVDAIAAERPPVVILDRRLPDMDGLDVCRSVREVGFVGSIIMLSGQASEIDRVYGLNNGADDYIGKPFSVAELMARVSAAMRRSEQTGTIPAVSASGSSITIDVDRRQVLVHGRAVSLSAREFDILALLHSNNGAVVTRSNLLAQVWQTDWNGAERAVDVAVARLRAKLAESGSSAVVTTIRGVGFRLDDD